MSTERKLAYAVEVIGFNQTERIVLSSIFGLSARRSPKFLQHNTVNGIPDIYLVDAADPQAVELLKHRNAARNVPVILIGDSDHGTGYPALARPLQWSKLFRAFDLAITAPSPSQTPVGAAIIAAARTQIAAATAPMPDKTLANTTIVTPVAPQAAITEARTHPTSTVAPSVPVAAPAWVAPPVPLAPAAETTADWVLVVDDNLTVREFMKTKLAPFGFNIDYAESGEQAVGFTGMKHYACAFLDVIMPGIDGYQVCKLIKSKKGVNKTAVVMLTSKGSPFDKIRGAMAGCDAYLTKPVDEDKLLETIVRFLPVGKPR